MRSPCALPLLPLPSLIDTLGLYLDPARPFLAEKAFENTSLTIRAFQEGLGQKLQGRLLERSQDPRIDDWQHDLQAVRKHEPVPPLFGDSTWEMMRVTSTRKVKTDAWEGLIYARSRERSCAL